MGLTDTGRRLMLDLAIGAGGTPFNAANGFMGFGTSATAFAASQTDLVTPNMREVLDGQPTRATDTLTFIATLEAADANIAIAEVGIFNAASSGTMLCRLVTALGTKASPAVWTVTYTLQIT